jgi:hypothetical protein
MRSEETTGIAQIDLVSSQIRWRPKPYRASLIMIESLQNALLPAISDTDAPLYSYE